MVKHLLPLGFASTHLVGLTLLLVGFLASPAFSASSIKLTWDANPEPDLMGYYVYMGTSQGSYHTTKNAGLTPSHIFQNLPEGSTYYFTVTAYDQTGNISEPAQEVAIAIPTQGGSGPLPDTTPPTITIMSPQSSAPLSGTITVSATASDNIGVVGVQFRINGNNLGPEDTTKPFSLSWDTTTVSNGSSTLTATARDATGNTTTATPVTVIVSNTTSPALTISNLTVASRQSYVVPPAALQVGATVYIDRSFTFTTVPASVEGAAFIRTANNDKAATNAGFLSFNVNQPVTVYVAHDVRITSKPSWLTTFTDTGKDLATSDATLHLFARAFPVGTITLGGNAGSDLSMYSVIVQRQNTNQSHLNNHDLNGDGKADLIWRNTKTGEVAGWLLNGASVAASDILGQLPIEWAISGVGDLNGDGKTDLVWRNNTSGAVAVWLMDGLTITSTGFLGTVPTSWGIQAIEDMNGDGKADLLWRNTTDGNTAIWLMNGTAIVSTGFPAGVSLGWQIAGVGDVNGDGKADVIWRHDTSSTVAIWLMNGLTITSTGFPGSVPTTWGIHAVGDANGDGKADLFWRNTTDGNTAIWLMNGTAIASSGFPGTVSVAWQIAGANDVNGDGKADVIWRNPSNGGVAVWLMNGLTITSTGFPGTTSADWEIQ
ncbi:FG-GAP-like repeat-containing protein [uncultured Nitrospira sp.]|uniref:FG-GAP-like repeat-containing protein n=1 Tax=uncultured Nitrospira sp. TaxID=157176 RepID=UPI003140155C